MGSAAASWEHWDTGSIPGTVGWLRNCQLGHNRGSDVIPGPGTPYAEGESKKEKKEEVIAKCCVTRSTRWESELTKSFKGLSVEHACQCWAPKGQVGTKACQKQRRWAWVERNLPHTHHEQWDGKINTLQAQYKAKWIVTTAEAFTSTVAHVLMCGDHCP